MVDGTVLWGSGPGSGPVASVSGGTAQVVCGELPDEDPSETKSKIRFQ